MVSPKISSVSAAKMFRFRSESWWITPVPCDKRAAVTKAVLNLIQASNPQDEAFVVNFNDDSYLDQDFTNSLNPLHEALDRVDSRGGPRCMTQSLRLPTTWRKAPRREKSIACDYGRRG